VVDFARLLPPHRPIGPRARCRLVSRDIGRRGRASQRVPLARTSSPASSPARWCECTPRASPPSNAPLTAPASARDWDAANRRRDRRPTRRSDAAPRRQPRGRRRPRHSALRAEPRREHADAQSGDARVRPIAVVERRTPATGACGIRRSALIQQPGLVVS